MRKISTSRNNILRRSLSLLKRVVDCISARMKLSSRTTTWAAVGNCICVMLSFALWKYIGVRQDSETCANDSLASVAEVISVPEACAAATRSDATEETSVSEGRKSANKTIRFFEVEQACSGLRHSFPVILSIFMAGGSGKWCDLSRS